MKLQNPIRYHRQRSKWKKLGDTFLLAGTTLSGFLAGYEAGKGWVIASVMLTMIGKLITNWVDDESQESPMSDGN